MNCKNNKGALFYTLVGIMIAALVTVIALHIMRSTYDHNDADQIRLQRYADAIYALEDRIQAGARYAGYPAIWKAGHNLTPEGVNYYLTIYDGRDRMKKDLTNGFAQEINNYLRTQSTVNETERYVIESNGIPFTIYKIGPTDVSITETQTGMTYNVNAHVRSEDGKYRFDHTMNVSTEVSARLFAMFDKAKAFHEKYVGNVQWATTIALYSRAYYGAYTPEYEGSFLREGHLAYDPLDQVLRGDLTALQDFKADAIDDLGSIPAATWLTEWQILGEPGYLPTGVDFEIGKEGNAQITQMIKNTYDIQKAAGCDTLSGSNKTACEEFNDPVAIREKADAVAAEREKMQAMAKEIGDWHPNEDMTCDEFRGDAERIIDGVVTEFSRSNANAYVINPAVDYGTGTNLESDIKINNNEITQIEVAVNLLGSIRNSRLSIIDNSLCSLASDMDCSCGKGPDDCEDPTNCLTCNNPSCNKIQCGSGSTDYSCGSLGLGYYRKEYVDCERETCDETCDENGCSIGECEIEELTKTVRIDQCNCQCHPRTTLIREIQEQLAIIETKINNRVARLLEQENELNYRAATVEEAQSKFEEINSLTASPSSSGYDVISRLDYNEVRYFMDVGPPNCYINPTWVERTNGTCGNYAESTGLYTGQISAAVICCGLAPTCCPVVQYSTQWFPAIYRVEGNYNISETIVDDRNRIMLHNLFAGDQDLYGYNVTPKLFTHVAPEFVIYQSYGVKVAPKTGDRVLVYLYLPKIAQTSAAQGGALDKVLSSFTDLSCAGDEC